jgi:hypothetical protein
MAGQEPGFDDQLPQPAGKAIDLEKRLQQKTQGQPEPGPKNLRRRFFPVCLPTGAFLVPGLPHEQTATERLSAVLLLILAAFSGDGNVAR